MVATGILLSGWVVGMGQVKLTPLEQKLVGKYKAISRPGMTPDSKGTVLILRADRSFTIAMPGNSWNNHKGKWVFKPGIGGWKLAGVLGTLILDYKSYAFDGEKLLNPERRVTNFQRSTE